MNENQFDFDSSYIRETLGSYTSRTFFWMFLGLLVTFSTAWWGASSGLVWRMLWSVPGIQLILLVAELAVVIMLSARIHKIGVTTARVLFFVYAVITGVTFSVLFVAYDLGALILTFGMTSLYFGGMALYGHFTKSDLARLRPILMGGLIFLIVFGLISLFLPMGSLERVGCLVGMAIFLGFTAYDTQKIKTFYYHYSGDPELLEKASIISALQLYLDFINLFLYLLRFFGNKKD